MSVIYPNPKPRVSFPSWAIVLSDRDLPSQNGGKNTRTRKAQQRKQGRKPGSCPTAGSLCVLSTAAGQALFPTLGSRVPCPSPAPSGDTDFSVSTVPPGCHHPGLDTCPWLEPVGPPGSPQHPGDGAASRDAGASSGCRPPQCPGTPVPQAVPGRCGPCRLRVPLPGSVPGHIRRCRSRQRGCVG